MAIIGTDVRPSSMSTPDRVIAVAVTYHPEATPLRRALGAALAQVSEILVVDNGSPDGLLAEIRGIERVSVIHLEKNHRKLPRQVDTR